MTLAVSGLGRRVNCVSTAAIRVRGPLAKAAIILAFAATAIAQPASPWFRVRTPNFTVVTATNPAEAERTAAALEAFSEAFRRLVPDARVDPLAPTTVLVFDRFESYEPYAPRYGGEPVRVAGSFVGSPQANYLAIVLGDGPRAWSVAYHELTHLIVNQTMVGAPTWFNEGLADFYSTFVLGENGAHAELGHVIPEYLRGLRRERWLPLDDLLMVDSNSALYNESDKRSMLYWESWAVVHYLLTTEPARSTALFDFLGRVTGGQATLSAFRAAFGMAPGTLEDEVRRHVERSEWPVQRYSLGAQVLAGRRGTAEPLTEADARTVLSRLLQRLDRIDDAHALAQSAVNLDPDCAAAWAQLATAHVNRHLDVEALPFLQKALALGLRDPVAAHQVATSAMRINDRAGEAVLRRRDASAIAVAASSEAVAAAPFYAEGWASLAHAWLLGGTDADAALTSARRARTLAPLRRHYALLEAQALMLKGDLGAARAVLESVLDLDLEPALSEKFLEVLSRVTTLEEARRQQARPRTQR